jgi:Tol biopolymer transport system component
MKRLIACAAIYGVSLLGTVAVGGQAHATTPGRNGRIAFGLDKGGGSEIYTIRPDGSHMRRLTHLKGNAWRADWAPHGHRILFELDNRKTGRARVMIMNSDGTHIRNLTRSHSEIHGVFTPDGHHILYECGDCPGGDGIFRMRANGTHRHRLTRNPFGDSDTNPQSSPDGNTITFVRIKVGGELQALFAMHRDGSHLRRIAPYSLEVGVNHDCAPNGHQIVLTPYADLPEHQSSNVATMRPNGSFLRVLTRFVKVPNGAFSGSYSPNGRWIVFREFFPKRGIYKLMKMHPDGTHRQLIRTLRFVPTGSDWGAHS